MKYGYCPACLDKWYRNGRQRGPGNVLMPPRRLHCECEKVLKGL